MVSHYFEIQIVNADIPKSYFPERLLHLTNAAINNHIGQCWVFSSTVYSRWFKWTHIWYKDWGLYKVVRRAREGMRLVPSTNHSFSAQFALSLMRSNQEAPISPANHQAMLCVSCLAELLLLLQLADESKRLLHMPLLPWSESTKWIYLTLYVSVILFLI